MCVSVCLSVQLKIALCSLHSAFHYNPFIIWVGLIMLKGNWNTKPSITKTYLYNFDPLKPHFYIVKLGFTGVYVIFLILLKNIDCGYSLEPPHRGGSNEYPQFMFWSEIWKISVFFIWKFSVFGCENFYIFEYASSFSNYFIWLILFI